MHDDQITDDHAVDAAVRQLRVVEPAPVDWHGTQRRRLLAAINDREPGPGLPTTPEPRGNAHRSPPSRGMAVAAAVVLLAGGLVALAVLVRQPGRDDPPVVSQSTTQPTIPSPTDPPPATTVEQRSERTTPGPRTTVDQSDPVEEMNVRPWMSSEVTDWIGTYTITVQPANLSLGRVGDYDLSLDMNSYQWCIVHGPGGGGGCTISDSPDEPLGTIVESFSFGGGDGAAGRLRYLILPDDIEARVLPGTTPTCDLTKMPLVPYANANLWACVLDDLGDVRAPGVESSPILALTRDDTRLMEAPILGTYG